MNDQTAGQNTDAGIEGLLVWRKAIDLAVYLCHDVLPTFPDYERYALANQLRRSVQSVPANIAEGYGRFYYQEAVRFCYIARGSLEETRTHLVLASRLGYINTDVFQQLDRHAVEIRSLLNGYISFLKRSKRGINEPGSTINEPSGFYSTDSLEDLDESSLPQNSEPIDSELDSE
ncbi:four helix bundle protein [Longilinea arvoryzae]|uniref:Four helix bundle protein n=1 Tax=Longilinea arvoryzae TaxID=360412 RepID=A0A0S7BI19_9CHLR|nr:four helix bundle protein [Longilinea arvoryzae]GAP13515.1 four helix bundle protein [Longilinea arvoryzae]